VLGSLALREGQLSTAALPQLVREIVVELRARPDGVIRLEQASARAAQGRIRAEGGVQLSSGALRTVDLQAVIDQSPIAAGALGLWLNTKLVVTGRAADDTLRVKVIFPYGTLRLPKLSSGSDSDMQALGPLEDLRFIDAAARAAAAEAERQAEAEAQKRSEAAQKGVASAPPLLPPRTLVTVELPRAFEVTGPEVKTNIQGHIDAEISAQAPGPIVTGEIRTLGGWVEILNRRYQLDRGQVSMSGAVPPNPMLNIVLMRKLDDTTIYIQVGGTARKPTITFRSDPARYDQAQIIAMVLSGSRGGSIQQQALGALSGLLVGKLKDTLGKAVPVDVIKLDVGGNDASGANQSSLEVGKYLRDNLYLSYTHRFGNPSTILRRLNNDQVSLEWYFLPDYQINLMGGDQGVGALNLYWMKRF
jgi:translocation and assembly module TamB